METSSILYIALTSLLGLATAAISFFLKSSLNRLDLLEKSLVDHKIDDAAKWSEFSAHKEEVLRRLDTIESKIDKLLEK